MNTLAHFAINADDVTRARAFYEKVFGWKSSAWGPPGFYMLELGASSGLRGSLQQRRELVAGKPTIGFECTISVDSIDQVEKAVAKNGGKVVMQRSVISGVGTLMFFEDTEGNVFGAMQYDATVK
jgi:uncharacterized protein